MIFIKKYHNLLGLFLFVVMAAASRLIPHPPNLAPITALALFSGATGKFPRAFLPALGAMAISDAFIGFSPLSITVSVYGSFAFIALLGAMLRKRKILRLPIIALTSSLAFFIVTNFSVWLASGMYEHNPSGFIAAYINALPFFRNTVIGDMVYSTAIFVAFFQAPKLFFAFKRVIAQKRAA